MYRFLEKTFNYLNVFVLFRGCIPYNKTVSQTKEVPYED